MNTPQPITVVCDERGTPVEVEMGRREDGKTESVGEVLESWVVRDEWWRPPGVHRRYVEVILEGGAHVILFENLNTSEWFVQQP